MMILCVCSVHFEYGGGGAIWHAIVTEDRQIRIHQGAPLETWSLF